MGKLAWIISLIITSSSIVAHADEQMHVTATGGAWVAMAHYSSLTAAADVCMAMSPATGVGFRASEDGIEIRVFSERWSLPTDVSGSVAISVGGFSKDFAIGGNTASSISALIATDDAALLFSAMNKASTMLVTAGRSKPLNISLSGSTKVTNAFLTCAGIRNGASSPSSNPFQ